MLILRQVAFPNGKTSVSCPLFFQPLALTLIQSAPSPPPTSHSNAPSAITSSTNATAVGESGGDATAKLAEAIDVFLGDLEKRFKGISDEILTRLDDMAERCDRLEQEMLLRETSFGGDLGAGGDGKEEAR